MAISEQELTQIESLLIATAQDNAFSDEFRRRFPQFSLTRCAAADMGGEPPFRRYSGCELHLVDRSDHCWRLTSDLVCATGIVVAQCKAGT